MKHQWPELNYQTGKATYETLQRWTQIVGKIKLATLPWINHSWHITLHFTPSGITTQMMPYEKKHFQIDFDFLEHRLAITTSTGDQQHFQLFGLSVAAFYEKIFFSLEQLGVHISIKPVPVEIPNPVPFKEDHVNATYDITQVTAFHKSMLLTQDVLLDFRSGFKGKASPVHFFWGSFDLAMSFFSGRRAPRHPGGIPGLPNWVAEEAYCREVSSCGFWMGSDALPEAAFYSYLYPEPEGYSSAHVIPDGAYYHDTLREWVLPYSIVQKAEHPENILFTFIKSVYENGATLAHWDRPLLED
jgi:Family of unknown function (DUF5996)